MVAGKSDGLYEAKQRSEPMFDVLADTQRVYVPEAQPPVPPLVRSYTPRIVEPLPPTAYAVHSIVQRYPLQSRLQLGSKFKKQPSSAFFRMFAICGVLQQFNVAQLLAYGVF